MNAISSYHLKYVVLQVLKYKMNQKFQILLFIFLSTIIVNAQGQERKAEESGYYSDRITDVDGQPLSGIMVRVRGKGVSVKTDINGEFTIKADLGDIIILSKNGRTIDTYRYDGSLNYKVNDEADVLGATSEKRASKKLYKIGSRKRDEFSIQLDSALLYSNTNPSKSIDYLGTALNFAGNNRSQLAQSYEVLGDVYMNLKQYDLAADNYKIANDNRSSIVIQLKLANAHLLNDEKIKSRDIYNDLLKNNSITTSQRIVAYEGLGDAYFMENDYQKALQEYQTALNLSERVSNKTRRTNINSKIATTLDALGERKEAEGFLNRSIESAEEESPQKAVIQSQRAADFYSKNNSLEKEVQQRKRTLKTLEDEALDEVIVADDKKITKSRAKLELGNAYLKQNRLDEAIPLLEESVADAESNDDLETQKDAVQKLSEAYVSLGNEDKALSSYKKYVSLVDVLYKQKKKKRLPMPLI